jgi:hypothetical protein
MCDVAGCRFGETVFGEQSHRDGAELVSDGHLCALPHTRWEEMIHLLSSGS